ncbi:tetratricopeptide repeat protein [Actinoplanes sp. NPDC026619]|uniref:tetratricopeptide repeat protein n=1 Tax=Actinoplanes sp. NPDC026619 TaxID=3155798 RepID=UPI0033C09C42
MSVPANLPPDVAGFTGRDAEIAALDADSSAVTVLHGPPGAGKSALAVHWARAAARRYPDGRLYLDLRGFGSAEPRDPADGLRLLLTALGVEPGAMPADLDGRLGLFHELTASRRLLLILDNARDDEQVRPLLPAGDATRTVVTSRGTLTGLIAGAGARPLAVAMLPPATATELFRRRLGPEETEAAAEAEIVRACAGLPLALALAAARIRTASYPLAALTALAAEMRRPVNRLEALGPARVVFSWSYHGLEPAAARLFRLLGLATGPDIGLAPAAALDGRPPAETRRTLRELVESGLVAEPAPNRFAMHDLIRSYALELAREQEPADGRRAALTRLLDHYTHTAYQADLVLNPTRAPIPMTLRAPADDSRPRPLVDMKAAMVWLRGERETLLAAVRQARDEGLDTQAWQLSWALDSFLHEEARWDEEGAAWAVALDSAATLADGPALAYAYSFLAVADGRRQRFAEAQANLSRALAVAESAGEGAGDVTGIAECRFILSYLWWLQGDQEQALAEAGAALELFDTAGDTIWAGKAALAVGWYHAQRAEPGVALPHFGRALALQQRVGDWENEAITRDSLGLLHLTIGEHDHAARHFEEGLRLARKTDNPVLEAQILAHLGDLYESLRDPDVAAERWRQAYAILADLSHPQAADLRRKLAPGKNRPEPAGIRGHRLRRGMSQEELAERTGLSVRTIRYLESRKAGRPRPETVRLLADAFGLTGEERERFRVVLSR